MAWVIAGDPYATRPGPDTKHLGGTGTGSPLKDDGQYSSEDFVDAPTPEAPEPPDDSGFRTVDTEEE